MIDQEILDRIDEVIKASPTMDREKRFTRPRYHKLKKLQTNLNSYRDLLLDLVISVRQMEKALQQEITEVGRRY